MADRFLGRVVAWCILSFPGHFFCCCSFHRGSTWMHKLEFLKTDLELLSKRHGFQERLYNMLPSQSLSIINDHQPECRTMWESASIIEVRISNKKNWGRTLYMKLSGLISRWIILLEWSLKSNSIAAWAATMACSNLNPVEAPSLSNSSKCCAKVLIWNSITSVSIRQRQLALCRNSDRLQMVPCIKHWGAMFKQEHSFIISYSWLNAGGSTK